MSLKLPLSIIQDPALRQALQMIQDEHNSNPLNSGKLKSLTIYEASAVTDKELFHGLGLTPTDIIISRMMGASISFDYDSATTEKINYTTTGAIEAHILIGRFS